MQIALQLIYHGKAEYDHIHDIVPWPDTEAMPRFISRYAVPLKQSNHWTSAPERMRVIKTHFNWDLCRTRNRRDTSPSFATQRHLRFQLFLRS
jgi:hypothetical protein